MIPTTPGIYQIKNSVCDRIYIGSAVNLRKRWSVHRHHLTRGTHQNQHLQRAWTKYGEAAFQFSVVEHVGSKSDLIVREQHWLDVSSGTCELFNIALTAGSSLGRKVSDVTRKKMSESARAKKVTDATRAKMSALRKNKPLPHMAKIIAANKLRAGTKCSPESKEKMSLAARLRVARDSRRGPDGQFIGAARGVVFSE